MTLIRANDIEIDFAEVGQGPALVLVRGLGTQRIQWPDEMLKALAGHGLRVITFDNRDVGLSQKFTGGTAIAQTIAAQRRGEDPGAPYSLADMANDIVGLLDALGIERAHVAGMSLGGAIVQRLALLHGERLHSMTSIMSTSGASGLPNATPQANAALLAQPDSTERDAVVAHDVRTNKVFAGPGYALSDEARRAMAERCYDRCYLPSGVGRQMLAFISDRGRAESLDKIRVPTLVIHGEDDPLIPIACGRDTAERIPGAVFYGIPGMGHELTPELCPIVVEAIADHVKRSAS